MNPTKKAYVDYTLVYPDTTLADFKRFCEEALQEENRTVIRSVCVLPDPNVIKLCKVILEGSGILVSVVNDFPLGRGGISLKHCAAIIASDAGANEIDTVLNTAFLREGKFAEIIDELTCLVEIFPDATKVIIESGHPWYDENKIKLATELVATSKAFCVKTSTTMVDNVPPEVKIQHIKWMHEAAPNLIKKLSGGVRKLSQVEPLWDFLPPEKLIVGASTPFWKNP
ncbi:MAG: hypothetical protein HYW38_00380, partial [Candidatus Colwellbacteria bacterium]|nr:hypothetical protein [Candidatus Yanofskybacteria bacterium]MBI2594710.1 hypothetical protein [Candidatus Colwellbacteria bacterium]